jgi:hypothetical protein
MSAHGPSLQLVRRSDMSGVGGGSAWRALKMTLVTRFGSRAADFAVMHNPVR